jgi:hypothetical protein
MVKTWGRDWGYSLGLGSGRGKAYRLRLKIRPGGKVLG